MRSAALVRATTSAFGGSVQRARPRATSASAPQRTAGQRVAIMSKASVATCPPPIVIGAKADHTATVIMLHGLGDTGHGWADIGTMLSPELQHVKWVFPNAPTRPITLNGGMRMPGWFDLASLDKIESQEDTDGAKSSAAYVDSLVAAEEEAGVPSDRVVVAGFSQGGAVALLSLRGERKLAGVVGLSSWLMLRDTKPYVSDANKGTPVFMGHGSFDNVVQYTYGKATAAALEPEVESIEFKTYDGMAHSACPEELSDLKAFLNKAVPAK